MIRIYPRHISIFFKEFAASRVSDKDGFAEAFDDKETFVFDSGFFT